MVMRCQNRYTIFQELYHFEIKQLFSLEVLFLEILTWYSPLLGFDDVLDILERLTPLDFCLPEDLAIRHLTRANEAFGDNY
jgi:hypothetical protein